MAYIFRLKYRKNEHNENLKFVVGKFELEELDRAEKAIIRIIQAEAFDREITLLKEKKPLKDENKMSSLDPFVDEFGLIRVGGRIHKSILSYSDKLPIILPKDNHVSNLIIMQYHLDNFHSGIQNTLYSMRQQHWMINSRVEIRRIIQKCISCFKANPTHVEYKMVELPSDRVQQSRVFSKVGVDFCGPFYIREKKDRNTKSIKCYVAIFVCMAVKAVHIEVVSDLSTEAFIGSLKRFIGRRSCPEVIHCDNGTNFKGAHNELNELYQLFNSQELNHAYRA